MKKYVLTAIACLSVILGYATHVQGDLVLTIDNYTIDELKITINGTFDTDTVGTLPGLLGIKNDWSNNIGVSTELFFAGLPTVTSNTLMIGGLPVLVPNFNDGINWGDSMYIQNPNGGASIAFTAGTVVSGSVTLSSPGGFNPANAATIQLLSGLALIPTASWARLESGASVVPEPATFALVATILGCAAIRRRR